jgi:hypothetical protein
VTEIPQVNHPEFLLGLGSIGLEEFAEHEGEKAFRGRQILQGQLNLSQAKIQDD